MAELAGTSVLVVIVCPLSASRGPPVVQATAPAALRSGRGRPRALTSTMPVSSPPRHGGHQSVEGRVVADARQEQTRGAPGSPSRPEVPEPRGGPGRLLARAPVPSRDGAGYQLSFSSGRYRC